jgi:hypothetical protein
VCTIADGVQRIKAGAQAVQSDAAVAPAATASAGTDSHIFTGAHAVPSDILACKKHVVVLDVDSKDLSFGVSFPPVAFLSNAVLGGVAAQLEEGGLLIVNVASRNPKGFHAIVRALRRVFRHTFQCTADEGSTNQVVVAMLPRGEALSETQDEAAAISEAAMDVTSTSPFLTVQGARKAGELVHKLASPALAEGVDVQDWADELRPTFGEDDQILLARLASMSGLGAVPAPKKKKGKNRRGGGKKKSAEE